MSGHVFISYSRHDAAYVERLAAHLRSAGFKVWYDHRIASGVPFVRAIRKGITDCASMIVIMTPEAERSRWVEREISEADRLHKAILPLLLRGDRFLTLAELNYEDVRDSEMPGAGFIRRLREAGPEASGYVEVPFFDMIFNFFDISLRVLLSQAMLFGLAFAAFTERTYLWTGRTRVELEMVLRVQYWVTSAIFLGIAAWALFVSREFGSDNLGLLPERGVGRFFFGAFLRWLFLIYSITLAGVGIAIIVFNRDVLL